MHYSVVFSSLTGNTRLLAETVRETLPEASVTYFGAPAPQACSADRIYVGFWTDKGSCDSKTAEFLDGLRDKEVFFFGSAGFGGDPAYFEKILTAASAHLDPSCRLTGSFMCQGKMPMSVRDRYVRMQQSPDPKPNLELLIRNFDAALSHPDDADLAHLREAVRASV